VNNNEIFAQDIVVEHATTHESDNSTNDTNGNGDTVDDISNSDYDQYAIGSQDFSDDMDLGFASASCS